MNKLTKVIFNVLESFKNEQINLASEAARKKLASEISKQIKKNM